MAVSVLHPEPCDQLGPRGDCSECRHARGLNGHSPDLGLAASIRREAMIVPCAARIANQQWCTRADGHDGEHKSEADPVYGPLEERPALWRSKVGRSP